MVRTLATKLLLAGLVITTSPAFAAEKCGDFSWITLGTAGGPIPTPQRSEPANLLIAGDQKMLVDTGDGTVGQLARAGMDLSGIRTVFISHHHMDHTGGLAAVIGLRWMNTMPGVLTVYGPPGTKDIVEGAVKAMQPQAKVGFGLGVKGTPPEDSVRVVEIAGGAEVILGDIKVTTAANSHFDHPGPKSADDPVSLSYRFQLGTRSVTYTGDTGPSAAVTALAKGSDMLVSEIIDPESLIQSIKVNRPDMSPETFGQMRRHLTSHHITAVDLGKLAAEAGVKRLVLTHFAVPPSPIEQAEPALRSGISQSYSGPVELAKDLARFDIACH